MAASSPLSTSTASGWAEAPSSSGINTQTLEIGVAGMSLMSGIGGGGSRPPTLSGSTVSSDEPSSSRNPSYGSISIPSADHGVPGLGRGTPPSPMSPLHKNLIGNLPQNLPKPPGLHGSSSMPSPIGKSSVTHTTGSCSPTNLSLTPNSSIAADDHHHGMKDHHHHHLMGEGRSAPVDTGSQLSWNNERAQKQTSDNPTADFSSLDGDDGLHGLGALRERAQSSPGPFAGASSGGVLSSSPPVRIDISSFSQGDMSPLNADSDSVRQRNFPPNPRHRRGPSGGSAGGAIRHSRPPLSGGGGSYSSLADNMDDRYHIGQHRPRSVGANEMDLHQQQQHQHQQHSEQQQRHILDQQHTQKFGNFMNLNTHVQQQQQSRLPPSSPHHNHQIRHIRSYSGPSQDQQGLMHNEGHQLGSSYDGRSQQGGYFQQGRNDGGGGAMFQGDGSGHLGGGGGLYGSNNLGLSRSVSESHGLSGRQGPPGLIQRSTSLSQQALSTGSVDSFNNSGQQQNLPRRNSDNFHGGYGGGAPSIPNRMQHLGPSSLSPRYDDSPVMATQEEMRLYGIGSHSRSDSFSLSSQYSPSPQYSSSPSRRHSDYSNQTASSPISIGSLNRRGQSFNIPNSDMRSGMGHLSMSQSARGLSSLDDDLTHPLAGEYIDDPTDHMRFTHSRDRSTSSLPPHLSFGGGGGGGYGGHGGHMDRSPIGMGPQYVDSHHHHLPTAGASYSVPRQVYTVKFKRTQRNFILGPRFRGDLKIACYVKVEADRGEDLGIVVAKISGDKFSGSGRSSFRGGSSLGDMMGPPGGIADLKRITRLATHDEVSLLTIKREEEEELLKICRAKVRQRALPMTVVDAEYQFDRHKLTFFFEAEGRIDFRELVRDLFSMYKTRIWMQQLDKNGPHAASPGPGYLGGGPSQPPGAMEYGGVGSNLTNLSSTSLPQMSELTDQFAAATLGSLDMSHSDQAPPHQHHHHHQH
eukprot:CAMPEP_0194069668 /NCGR_PEP_ID=MMETSP0009_2-20130614/87765_1 /TAXON_ID=210454 /ORGANISM="Grammatophora oceanica, Strain CCMP 410" /LENGTH=968 /DNA_ID=CAMNT_0038722879 /DNA_START=683 /DNA_END=3589 /DNA_ORIENTATION=-